MAGAGMIRAAEVVLGVCVLSWRVQADYEPISPRV